MREAVVAHDQCCETIGEGVDAGPGLRVRAFIWPDYVETRVDAGDGEPVEGRVAEGERCEVVRVRELETYVSFDSMPRRLAQKGCRRPPACSPGE